MGIKMGIEINKNKALLGVAAILCVMLVALFGVNVYADDTTVTKGITKGITIGDIDVNGMTEEEAMNKANEYINGFTSKVITLDVDGNKVQVTAGELGYYWKNTDIVKDAASHCLEGNVIKRYEEAKDIEHNGLKYEFELDVNDEVMTNTINEKCGQYNVPHVNAQLTRTGSSFSISKESSGRMIDMDTSVNALHKFLLEEWNKSDADFTLTVVDDNPVATTADCERVKDLLGTFSTKFSTGSSNYNRNENMRNGMKLLNGITLCQGETMSVNSFLEPWTADNGWKEAGTYVNGKVEDSLGGGICQVSTTLYNAVLLAELEVVERYNHSMSVGYVPLSMDAALAGTWKDLKIKNNTDTPIYIEGIYDASGRLTFNIYGEETRPSNRKVEYVSETLSTIPSSQVVKQDASKPAGYRAVTSSGHTGYTARLWKKVYVDGVLQSEEVVNKSSYAASPTYVTVGTGAAAEPETPAATPETPATPDTPAQAPDTSNANQTPAQDNNSGSQTNGQNNNSSNTGSGQQTGGNQSSGDNSNANAGGTDATTPTPAASDNAAQ